MDTNRFDQFTRQLTRTPSRRRVLKGLGGFPVAGMLAAALGLGNLGRATAQEATPATTPIAGAELAPGVVAEVFASAPSDRAPGQTVYVARFTFQPGAEIFPHSHPGTTVDGVVSGSFGWTLLAGTARVVRGAAPGAPTSSEDLTAPGTEVILEVGDAISYEEDVVHTARGAGAEPTVVHSSQVLTAGAPRMMSGDMEMGTPTAYRPRDAAMMRIADEPSRASSFLERRPCPTSLHQPRRPLRRLSR